MLFIRYYLFKKNQFKSKLILKRVTHKINRINNFVVVNIILYRFLLFILCILLLSGCKLPLVLMLVIVRAP